ncbi:MAG: BamA/TamA family outer membrane protein [Candidatus Cryptobacteroides sp.]
MKKCVLLALCLLAASNLKADDSVKGWNIGPLPCVSYNSDLGFQYGICADIFNYGDGKLFPEYYHRFYVEASRYTKGQTLLHAQYDSKQLIPGLRVTGAVSFQYDPLYYFYGFNGAESYNPTLNLNRDSGIARYNYTRSMLRVLLDLQGNISGDLNWAAGVSFWSMANSSHSSKYYDPSTSLYDIYVNSGRIPQSQAAGGSHLEMKAGVVYDSRDMEAAPSRGIWAEAYLNGSPDLFGTGTSYLKLVAHFRQYLSLWQGAVFAYHLAYQGSVLGESPFYMLPVIYTLYLRQTGSEGLGGYNTVRGLIQNALVGEAYLWGNFELRQRIVDFKFLGENWYLAVNPFVDAGYIAQPYREDVFGVGQRWAVSAGAGIKLAMNENFIISFEGAKVLGNNEYPFGSSIVLNYIF